MYKVELKDDAINWWTAMRCDAMEMDPGKPSEESGVAGALVSPAATGRSVCAITELC